MTAFHQPWCAHPGHDGDEPCLSCTQRLAFTAPARHDDEVTALALALTDAPGDGVTLNLIAHHPDTLTGFTLRPEQIRPLAMALLARDAQLLGDTDAARYYDAEATRETAGA